MSKLELKIVDARIIRVSTALYRTLTSFAASSLKAKYLWNVGIHLHDRGEDSVVFEKTGKWRLVVSMVEGKIEALLEAPLSCVKFNYDGGVVEVMDKMAGVITIKEPLEIMRTYLIPDKELPFSGPLSLAKIVDKMEMYIMAAQSHIAECAVHEEAEAKEEAETEAE
jgi:hypothetical protein